MYDRVFSPLVIKGLTIPNRVLRTAHATSLAHGEPINDDLIAYHLDRAKGGVGLTILEGGAIHPSSSLGLICWDDSVIPQYQKLVRAVEPTGMKLFQQFWHGGHNYPAPDGGPSWGASAVPSRYQSVPSIAMTKDQIAELVECYASAARRAEAGGLHGVEVHVAHGYLISQFLSPAINRRDDEYGGSFDNRLRFLLEVMRAIRDATSPDFVVGVRVSESSDPKVLSIEDVNQVSLDLQAEGLIDYLNISHGDYFCPPDAIAGMDQPAGYQMDVVPLLSKGITLPRFIAGRYGTLDDVEQALRAGHGDMVNMVRAHIADPYLVKKSREGRAHEVRPCIGCNQGCLGGIAVYGRISCTVNPAAGLERMLSEELIGRTDEPKHVLVVGGGPAGMEAARVAVLRGHRVTLAEATSRLGGAVKYAEQMPRLKAIGDIVLWLEAEIYRLGVEVLLSTYIEADEIVAMAPDAVIVATGTDLSEQPIVQGARIAEPVHIGPGARIIDSVQLLESRRNDLGNSAVVLDDVGHYEAIACCEELLGRGMDVTYVTRFLHLAPQIEPTLRATSAKLRLYAAGKFDILTETVLVGAAQGAADIKPIYSAQVRSIPADVVVQVCNRPPQNGLWHELLHKVPHLHLVGDAKVPRNLQVAIGEGHLAARSIA